MTCSAEVPVTEVSATVHPRVPESKYQICIRASYGPRQNRLGKKPFCTNYVIVVGVQIAGTVGPGMKKFI